MKLGAVLLAGGESVRMQQDKATLKFGDQPLWRRQLDLLRQVNPIELFISARSDPSWRPADAKFVSDEGPSRGPLSGITAAMNALTGTHLLALGVDMPFMALSQLKLLCALTQPGTGVLPKIGARAEPLAAIYPRKCLPQLMAALCGDDYSLQRLTNGFVKTGLLRVLEVPEWRQELYRSVNVPEDIPTLSDIEHPIRAMR